MKIKEPQSKTARKNNGSKVTTTATQATTTTATNDAPRAKLTVSLSPESYGWCCAAGIVHGISPEEALGRFLNSENMLMNWFNEGFPLR